MSGPYHVVTTGGPESKLRVLPVGHFSIIAEDCLKGLAHEFAYHMELKDLVEYLFGEVTKGPLGNPKAYILKSWTLQYLTIAGYSFDSITSDPLLYDYVFSKLEEGLGQLSKGMAAYVNSAMRVEHTRDLVLLRWYKETNIVITTIKEHDPFAF